MSASQDLKALIEQLTKDVIYLSQFQGQALTINKLNIINYKLKDILNKIENNNDNTINDNS